MIEGLQFQMKSADLQVHLAKRAAYHAERAAFYAREIKRFRGNAADSKIRVGQNTIVHTTGELEKQEREHVLRSKYFKIISKSVIPDETYLLKPDDLKHIEYVEQPVYFY